MRVRSGGSRLAPWRGSADGVEWRWTRRIGLLATLASMLAPTSTAVDQVGGGRGPAGGHAQDMKLVGHSDLGGQGLNGQVAVVGDSAVVATAMCR